MYKLLNAVFEREVKKLKDPEFKAKPRCLIILGLFCRFTNFKLPIPSGKSDKTLAVDETKIKWLFDLCVQKFARHQMSAYRRAGFSCLGSLFVRDAKLIMKEASKKVLNQGLATTESEEIRAVSLKALADFVEVDDTDAGATCLRNTIMQEYLSKILACAYCSNEDTAIAAVKLVSQIHERGQVHPQLCIPDLVAVQQRGRACAAIAYQVFCLNPARDS